MRRHFQFLVVMAAAAAAAGYGLAPASASASTASMSSHHGHHGRPGDHHGDHVKNALPRTVFAPYTETYDPADGTIATLAQQSGDKFQSLAFLQTATTGSCT